MHAFSYCSRIVSAVAALCLLSVSLAEAAPILRAAPEGTRLANDMVTPIYVESLDPAGDGTVMRVRLKDSTGYRVDLYAERTVEFSLEGEAQNVLKVYLHQPPRKQGALPLEIETEEGKAYLRALASGLENYAPGWTNNWSIEGHRELKELVSDLIASQFAS